MIVDLPAPYPMHLFPQTDGTPTELLSTAEGRQRRRDRIHARMIGLASRLANYRSFESRPPLPMLRLRDGGIGVVLSVLYSFFDELDLDAPYDAPPEAQILERHRSEAVVVGDWEP